MAAARTLVGLVLEVRPLPMAGALLTVLLGIAWAQGSLTPFPPAGVALLGCVFFGLYTAHLTDTFVDAVGRGDRTPADFPLVFRDSSGLLEDHAYPPLIAISATLCVLLGAVPAAAAGRLVALLLMFGLLLALSYAPLLDRTLLGVSFAYPLGAGAVLAVGYIVAGAAPDGRLALLLLPLIVALVGTKVRSDAIDLADDAAIGKRTLPVLLGERVAVRAGYGLALGGLAATAALPLFAEVNPAFALPPALAAAAIVLSARGGAMRSSEVMAYALVLMLAAEALIVGFLPA